MKAFLSQFFKERGYPDAVVKTAQHRAGVDRQTVLQTAQKVENETILCTFTFHPHNPNPNPKSYRKLKMGA